MDNFGKIGNSIIYVDDDVNISRIYKDVLEEAGYKVLHFYNPSEAIEHMKHNLGAFRFALIDYQMPELNGIEVLTEMSRNKFFGIEFPVLFSSLAKTVDVEVELNRLGLTRGKVWRLDKGPMKQESLKVSLQKIEKEMRNRNKGSSSTDYNE